MSSQPIASTEFSRPITPIGVLVVDDQFAVREGLARLIACAPMALRYVITAATAGEALSAAARLHPDIVVLDVDLAGDDGLALIPKLALTSGVLVLTSHGDAATRARAKRLGARAFIEKHQPAADLLGSIAEICRLPTRSEGEETPGRPGTSSPLPMAPSSDEKALRHS
ncbi:response regulator [Rhodoferax ferrireducens]|uniref:response regulator n=1 Tax=Rhodoferax ferrireducens TaxID=192843 RepID=UPI001300B80B|nr:response regulator transcription factor [Rhodoferax ferrireducens]